MLGKLRDLIQSAVQGEEGTEAAVRHDLPLTRVETLRIHKLLLKAIDEVKLYQKLNLAHANVVVSMEVQEAAKIKQDIAELKQHIQEFKQAVHHFNRNAGDMNPLLRALTKKVTYD